MSCYQHYVYEIPITSVERKVHLTLHQAESTRDPIDEISTTPFSRVLPTRSRGSLPCDAIRYSPRSKQDVQVMMHRRGLWPHLHPHHREFASPHKKKVAILVDAVTIQQPLLCLYYQEFDAEMHNADHTAASSCRCTSAVMKKANEGLSHTKWIAADVPKCTRPRSCSGQSAKYATAYMSSKALLKISKLKLCKTPITTRVRIKAAAGEFRLELLHSETKLQSTYYLGRCRRRVTCHTRYVHLRLNVLFLSFFVSLRSPDPFLLSALNPITFSVPLNAHSNSLVYPSPTIRLKFTRTRFFDPPKGFFRVPVVASATLSLLAVKT